MKKFISMLLVVCMICTYCISPAFAYEDEGESLPFSFNVEGDCIYFTDEEGYIREIRPNDATSYSALAGTGLLTLGSSGGVIASGAASIMPSLLVLYIIIVSCGYVIDSMPGIQNVLADVWHRLSPASQKECDDIIAAGGTSFQISETLAAEMETAMGEVFYNDDGSLKKTGITFDPTNMLEWNPSAQNVYGNALTSTIYKYDLSSTPVAIDGTSLTVALADMPFETTSGVTKALLITNTVTGATCYMGLDEDVADFDCCTWKISAPVVQTIQATGSEYVYHRLMFWVMSVCEHAANGGCSNHYYKYQSVPCWEGSYFLFDGTGMAELDGIPLSYYQYVLPYRFWYWYMTKMDGVEYVVAPQSPLVTICSDLTFGIKHDGEVLTPDKDKPLYFPTIAEFEDVNYITKEGVGTGDFSKPITLNPEIDVPVEGEGEGGILDAILAIPTKIVDGIKALILSLFLPSEGFMEEFIADISSTFEDRMGILTYPISVLYEFFDHLLDVGEEEPIFKWSAWKYEGHTFIPSGSFNLNSLLENGSFAMIHDIYLLLVDAGIVFGLIQLLRRKYDSIISH